MGRGIGGWREKEEEEEFSPYKNDLKRCAHTLSGDAGKERGKRR